MQTFEEIPRSDVRVRFYKEPVEDASESAKQGRPIFRDEEFVEVSIPGERLMRGVFLAHEKTDNKFLKSRAEIFAKEYQAFKRGEATATTGTPLEHWPIVTASRVMELKAMGIMSVDELAVISDSVVRQLGPGARELRDQASAFIRNAKDGAVVSEQARRIAELEAKLERMANQMDQLAIPPADEPQTVAVADASDAQLKQFIKDKTGEAPRGNISRETLLARVEALATENEQK